MTAPLASLADPTDERFTEAQRAKVAEFDAASEPPEIVVERLASAMWELRLTTRDNCRRLAEVAVAALDPS